MVYERKPNIVMKAQTTLPHATLNWISPFDLILQV